VTGTSLPKIGYHDFAVSLQKKVGQGRYPFAGTIELTPFCNLKCVHCYITPCEVKGNLLSTAELCRIIDEMAEAGCLWLLLTGGEPLLRPDFLDIYAHAKNKGILISLFTNATLLTPAIADYLAEFPPRMVEITLYGATKQTYEKITGVAGSYEKCLRGIEMLKERQIPLALKSVALTVNKHEIPAMQEYAEKMGVAFRWDPSIMPRIDHGMSPCDFRLTPEEVIEMELSAPERLEGWQDFCQFHWGPYEGDSRYICGAGRGSFFIDSAGLLSLCLSSRSQTFDLRKGTFREGWNTFFPQVLSQKVRAGSPCRSCELLGICARCAPWAEMETGDPDAEVEWLCRLAHLRVDTFGLKKTVQKNIEASRAP
jgi:radical SAM protein with 4Fe4S-binding SPASM domain